jgi:CRP-like cAMP-binding protein
MKGPDSGVVQVCEVGRGSLLGWSPVLGPGSQTATAHTRTPCRLAALDAAGIRALTQKDPAFGSEFLRTTAEGLAQRVRAMRSRMTAHRPHEPHALKEGAD